MVAPRSAVFPRKSISLITAKWTVSNYLSASITLGWTGAI
jgi:hypothetical protein